MTAEAIISAGVRNRAARLAQVERLRPSAATAAEKVESLRAAKASLGKVRDNFAVMTRHASVPGFFPTPRHLVAEMLEAAQLRPGMRVLEPSCGKGDIAHAIVKAGALCYCVEMVQSLAAVCRSAGLVVNCADFLEVALSDYQFADMAGGFDRVLMNPPFERGADLKHVHHAFQFLRPGGTLVAVVSSTAGEKLRSWDEPRRVRVEDLPAGSFARSDRPTNVNTALVTAIHY